MIFNREHAGVTHVNTCEFRSNQRIFTEVIVRMDRQTDRRTDRQTDRQTDGQTDRQTDKPKSLTLFNFSWKVLKMRKINF